MKDDRLLRILRPSLVLIALAAVLVLLGMMLTDPVQAASKSPEPKATTSTKARTSTTPRPTASGSGTTVVLGRGTEVRFGDDVVVPEGTRVPSVVAFGGDVVVNGRVTQSVVAFGGDVTVNGKVGLTTVLFGGDLTLGPRAVVGKGLGSDEASLVLFGGSVTKDPGARVYGQTESFNGPDWGEALRWIGHSLVFHPLLGLSFAGWVVQTVFCLVLALVAAALMPRQLRATQRQLARRPWGSLGWGALTFFVAVPVILVVLIISVIGLLLVLPYGVFVLLTYFFATTAVGAFLAQKVLTGFGGKENLMLAVTVGVVGTTVVSRIPGVGPVALTLMMVLGTGAAILAVVDWRRVSREAAAAQTAAAPAGPAPEPAPTATAITPIIQTSPPESGTSTAPPASPPQPPSAVEPPPAPATPAQPGVATGAETPLESPAGQPGEIEVDVAPADGEKPDDFTPHPS